MNELRLENKPYVDLNLRIPIVKLLIQHQTIYNTHLSPGINVNMNVVVL
jgi:hypothetical protein